MALTYSLIAHQLRRHGWDPFASKTVAPNAERRSPLHGRVGVDGSDLLARYPAQAARVGGTRRDLAEVGAGLCAGRGGGLGRLQSMEAGLHAEKRRRGSFRYAHLTARGEGGRPAEPATEDGRGTTGETPVPLEDAGAAGGPLRLPIPSHFARTRWTRASRRRRRTRSGVCLASYRAGGGSTALCW
jgi:hypothetical protein